MHEVLQTGVVVVGSVAASSGFWAYFTNRSTKKSAPTLLLLGLAYDRILYLGMGYIERGWISKDEYDLFFKHLYQPYENFGGNGLAKRVALEVAKLPIHKSRELVKEAVNEQGVQR